ncbi:MAG: DMT family transporter [Burkholderiaceae bacterium]
MRLTPKTVGIAAAVITILIWTSFIVVARFMALRGLTPMDIVLCRILGASAVLLPWGYWMVRKMHAARLQAPTWLGLSPLPWRITVLVGAVGGVGYAVLAYSAFVYAPAAHGSVLLPGMLPLSTALFSVWLLREHLSRGRMLGLAMIFGGALLVGGVSLFRAAFSLDGPGSQVWKGDVLFVCASTCWAFYAVMCRKHALGAVPATIAVIVFCALSFIPVYALLVGTGLVASKLGSAPWSEIAFQAVWQGMGSVVISGITFTKMIQYFGPIRSTMLTAVVPGLSAMGAVIFLGEPLHWNLVAGLALVTLGIVVGVRAASKAAPAVAAAPAIIKA